MKRQNCGKQRVVEAREADDVGKQQAGDPLGGQRRRQGDRSGAVRLDAQLVEIDEAQARRVAPMVDEVAGTAGTAIGQRVAGRDQKRLGTQ